MANPTNHEYLEGLPDLPDRPMTIKELADFYVPYQDELLKRFAPGTKEAGLRTNKQKRLKEGFHSYFFGSIYGELFGCRHIMTIHVREVVDRDALIEWKNGGTPMTLNLQLKELVSPAVNPRSESAQVELQKQLDGLPDQYPNATDLTVAFYMNYGDGIPVKNLVEPEKLNIGGLWFFGFSKPKSAELFLIGKQRNANHNFRLTWRHTQPKK